MVENIYNPEFVKVLFNRMSGSYERMNFITSFGFSIRWRRQFLSHLESTNEKVEIIDLLTGMGETWISVQHKFPNTNLTALDFSIEMLKRAEKKSSHYFGNRISLIQQDVLQNKLPSSHYDIVICAFGLKTFDNQQLETLAKETKRILKEGGQFSFIEVSKPENIILRALYRFYLSKAIPVLGKLLLGNPAEYRMLWRYTDRFQNARKATAIFNKFGLKTKYISYFDGCASGFSGKTITVKESQHITQACSNCC